MWPEGTVPVVSICSLTYNHEKFIRECLDGFLMQETTFPVEILIHDDASTDSTANIIREYEAQYPRIIKPIYQRENQYSRGASPGVTFLLPRAKGNYIALCEGDDYWTDSLKLQKQVDFLDENPDYVICYHDAKIIDEAGNVVADSKLPEECKKDFSSEELMKGEWALTLSIVFRNVVTEYPEEIYKVLNVDTFLTVILGKYGKGKYLAEIEPAVYRKQPGSVWSSLHRDDQTFQLFNSLIYIYQYHMRTSGREFAVDFLMERVLPFLQRLFPERNPYSQIWEREKRLRDSYTYRVGKFILWPFKKVRSLWRAIIHRIGAQKE